MVSGIRVGGIGDCSVTEHQSTNALAAFSHFCIPLLNFGSYEAFCFVKRVNIRELTLGNATCCDEVHCVFPTYI